jgi:hypothetical protein
MYLCDRRFGVSMILDLIRTTRGVRPWEDNSERMLEPARKRLRAAVPGEPPRDRMSSS